MGCLFTLCLYPFQTHRQASRVSQLPSGSVPSFLYVREGLWAARVSSDITLRLLSSWNDGLFQVRGYDPSAR